ncbi:DegT/DnrJ/EryC1/StrS family aminotransferase [Adhaeribacter aquaticus]|uniref:DegT/DnrJ/EryC1/StrS family aminotransferase n=1 Tax=Adhaeribacter aquaticus TaxID=299567 RepID=UPI00042098F5|nr:DegT/DnrJ/EryC1/StrS family aminotransferase [Adhaeribacter aquaticus]
MHIPFLSFKEVNQKIKPQIIAAFENFFDEGWYVLGERLIKFEKDYAEFNHTSHCVGVSNGLDALHLALKVLSIGPGDEVIVPSNTFIATALAVSYVGATPVFVEPKKGTYNIDPNLLEASITSKTKAIMPVHLYGQACEMQEIMTIANKRNIWVVEDNAQAQGATYTGKLTGSFGTINGTSFYPGKNLGAFGDAGAITTNDAYLANKVKILRNYGSEKKYQNDEIGYNMRLDECQAAFLSIKLQYLHEWTTERQKIAGWYNLMLRDVGDLILPEVAVGATHVYHLYIIRTKRRDALQQYLREYNIGSLIHYPIPPHLQNAYVHLGHKLGSFPVAEEIANTCLSLPLWPGMSFAETEQVANVIKNYFHG